MDSFTIIKGVWDKEKTQIQRDLYNQRRTEGMKESCPSQYSFVVDRRANKFQIRKAVQELFKVGVTNVNTMMVRGKVKRGRTKMAGFTGNWKKAVVTLKEGESIELV